MFRRMHSRLSSALILSGLSVVLLTLPRPIVGRPAEKKEVPPFAKVGRTFLEKHCIRCHNEKTKKADVQLHTFREEGAVLKNRKLWESVLTVVRKGEMPPASRPRPAQADLDAFLASVQDIFDRSDRNARPDPGRITVRRLNRTEYNNTIRDLVGVDFQPAEDFPSDDVGYGFDNIGDVLTLSPVLMERYLAAAEGIMQRAIVVNPPKPPVRWMNSRYLEPATPKAMKWRPLDARGNVLHTPYKLSMAGEYVFRVRCYAKMPDKEPVKIAVLLGDKELKRFEVTAEEKKPTTLELPLTLPKGDHRIFVKLLNPSGGENGRNLFVEMFNLNGPSDTRPESQRMLLATTPGKSQVQQTREVLTRFASKAYRRPATKEEIDRLVRLAESVQQRKEPWEAGIQLAMQAVLVSPKFLFRIEGDVQAMQEKPYPITEYQLASRLSYFLWSSMPDQELFDLAEKKELAKNIDAQVKRMLADPKSKAIVDNFAMQWLQLQRLSTHAPDPKMFPMFNDRLRRSMIGETKHFFDAIMRENRSILDLVDANFSYLDYNLAQLYGIRDTAGNRWGGGGKQKLKPGGKPFPRQGFVRVEFADGHRGGLLTQASILTVTSNPTRTSPVKRGKWVLEQILGTPPPPPPPNVPELAENDKAQLTGSLRQRMEQHRVNPACANCHAKMDPLGFAFENFDAVGRWRYMDGKFPIDASGTLPEGKTFKGAQELKVILKEKKDLVARCLTEKLLIYALGRGLEYYDKPTVDRIVTQLAKSDYRFNTLVTEIVKSYPFRMRRGKELSK